VTTTTPIQLATDHYHAGNFPEAERVCRQILAAQPHDADAWNLLGLLSYHAGRTDLAVELIHRALALNPNVPAYHSNLGNLLRLAGKTDDAIAAYQAALALDPNLGEVCSNLGSALAAQGRLDEAIAAYQQALERNPMLVEAHSNLGNARVDQGRIDQAIAAYRAALALRPDHAEVHCNLGMCLLLQGDLAAGWTEYEWRRQGGDAAPSRSRFSQPLWDGGGLAGRTILLHAEQGYGDTIQFIRYAPLVAARGGRVVVECPPELIDLLSQLTCVNAWVPYGQPLPPFDVHYPLLSLPFAFGTTLQSIPSYEHPLQVPADRAELGRRLSAAGRGDKLKVGLAWRGSPHHKNDRNRSIPPSLLAVLATAANAQFFSLQVQSPAAPDDAPPPGLPLVDVTSEFHDFADTAALIDHLDLVISVDTAVAHLAAAMQKPVWLLLPLAPDWRWLLARSDSPWYPTMRLFRQPTAGAWPEVLDEVAAALARHSSHQFGNHRAYREHRADST